MDLKHPRGDLSSSICKSVSISADCGVTESLRTEGHRKRDHNKVTDTRREVITVTSSFCSTATLELQSLIKKTAAEASGQHFPIFTTLSLKDSQTHPRLNHFIFSLLFPSSQPAPVCECSDAAEDTPSLTLLPRSLWPWEVLQRSADTAAVPAQDEPLPPTAPKKWGEGERKVREEFKSISATHTHVRQKRVINRKAKRGDALLVRHHLWFSNELLNVEVVTKGVKTIS